MIDQLILMLLSQGVPPCETITLFQNIDIIVSLVKLYKGSYADAHWVAMLINGTLGSDYTTIAQALLDIKMRVYSICPPIDIRLPIRLHVQTLSGLNGLMDLCQNVPGTFPTRITANQFGAICQQLPT